MLYDLLEDHADIGRDLNAVRTRVKDEESFLTKCSRGNHHDPFNEIKDIVGARVILYSKSKKATVQAILSEHLRVISVKDHSSIADSLYDGLHLICTVGTNRANLPEWSRYKDQVFEVQITTMAHNAWSEVEHRAIYKAEVELDEHHNELMNSANAYLRDADKCRQQCRYLDYAGAQTEALETKEEDRDAE